MNKPYAESCDQNREPILEILRLYLPERHTLLEIGSGTGQHAVYFAPEFPHLLWQTSDVTENHAGIRQWIAESCCPNVLDPIALDVNQPDWPEPGYEAVFSANTAHIMDWGSVEAMFAGIGRVLNPGGVFLLYGPFNYGGKYTSESNARFDHWLKSRDPASGIRNFDDLDWLAQDHGLELVADHAMPANNRTLVWQRS
ncbi:MAG: DUF938 domain-containing protein [Gammaproteobacteria bacterium]|nr:MAG: DUF938 domain-containing protein [Gammaproteobacteria bacterium]